MEGLTLVPTGGRLRPASPAMKHLPILLLLGMAPYLAAETVVTPENIREGEAKQQQLRGDAQRLVAQLDGMIGEYERNGLGGDEARTIQSLRDSLQKLSVEEMRRVVDLLEKARAANSAGEAKQRVSDAYTTQKAILTEMQKLLAEHLRHQQAQELSAQVAKLAERQAVNLQNGIALGQWSGGKKPENFEAAMQANLQGQQAEQVAIAEELRIAAQRVAAFARDPENGEMAERLKKGIEAIAQLQPKVDNAAEALRNGQLFKAVEDEKIARDALRRLARELAPPQNRADALRAAQKELAKAIEDQQEIANDAAKAAGEQDFDRWLDRQIAGKNLDRRLQELPREQLRRNADLQRAFLAQKEGRADELVAAENKQGDLAGKSDELAQALGKEAPAVAQDIKSGVDRMQEARGAMMDRNAPVAAANGRQALAALEAAQANLQQELAKADALAGRPADAADLRALQQQAQALAEQQVAAVENPDKSGQPALAQKIDQLAQRAAAQAPQAAAAAQQAAMQAQQAAQAAQAGQPAAAMPAQQAAAQNLAQAAQQIAQQAAQAQNAAPNAAAMQQAAGQLAQAQAALQQAGQSLQQAQQAQAAAQAAQAAAQQAQQTAQQAQQAGNSAGAAQAQQQAQQANQQAAAQQGAAQQASQQAAAQMGQAATQAGQVAAQGAAGNSTAQQAAQSAAQSATQGAAQANAQNAAAAQAQATAAQKALAQAQMALAQAQSGVTAAAPSASPGTSGQPGNQPGQPGMQPGQPGPPGQPGRQPGQMPGVGGTQAAQQDSPAGNEAVQVGGRSVADKKGLFTALPPRERAVIEQAQSEKYPEEYSAQIEQYLLNLARESAAKK